MFWIGAAVTAIALLVSFAWPQKTLPVRLALLALGLVGLGTTAYRYIGDQQQRAMIEELKPRHIRDDQKTKIIALLKSAPKPKEPIIFNLPLSATGEAAEFNSEIKSVLAAGGFDTKDLEPIQGDTLLGFTGSGTYLFVKDIKHPLQAAITLCKAFQSANITLILTPSPYPDPERVDIIVGSHP